MVEGLSPGDILQAHGAVHVNDQDAHNSVLDPGASNTVSDHTQLKLLANVEGAFLVLEVRVICAALNGGSRIAILSKDTVTTAILILTVSHRDSFNHIGCCDIGQDASDRHDDAGQNRA